MASVRKNVCGILGTSGPVNARELARELVDLAEDDPAAASAEAHRILEGGAEVVAKVVALRVLGLAHRFRGDNAASRQTLERAVELGERNHIVEATELARMSLGYTTFGEGNADAALRLLNLAIERLSGVARAEALFQRGTVMARIGDVEASLPDFKRALPSLSRHGPKRLAGHTRNNRGLVYLQLGQISEAVHEFQMAERIYREIGILGAAGLMQQNRALAEAAQGDYVRALATGQAAASTLEAANRPTEVVRLDRCEILLSLGLAQDAYEGAVEAIESLQASGSEVSATEGLIVLCRAAIGVGRQEEASRLASETAARFGSYGNDDWSYFRDLITLEAAEQPISELQAAYAEGLADDFARIGQWSYECRARSLAALGHLELGDHDAVATVLDALPVEQPPGVEIDVCYVRARLKEAAGNAIEALRLTRAGLKIADDNRFAIGASEARAATVRRRAELVELGTRLLSGSPGRQALFVEQHRTISMEALPVRQPNSELAAALAEYRERRAEVSRGALGRDDELRLGREIRRLSLARSGIGDNRIDRLTLTHLRRHLGRGVALVLYEEGQSLVGCAVGQDSVATAEVGRLEDIHEELGSALFWLRQLVAGVDDREDEAGAVEAAMASLDALASALQPLVPASADSVLLSTPNWLLTLPSSALQNRWGLPVVMTPSLSRWCHAEASGHNGQLSVVSVAGPGLPQATPEAKEVCGSYHYGELFVDSAAQVHEVLRALDGSAVAHFGCHGRFRSDNPMFSSLELFDGPLMAYDLELLGRAPDTVVLSACEVGRSKSLPGDEVLGMATAFMTSGTRSVVASILPVPDSTLARSLMVQLHRQLAHGRRPAAALLHASTALGTTPDDLMVRNLYSCFGWG